MSLEKVNAECRMKCTTGKLTALPAKNAADADRIEAAIDGAQGLAAVDRPRQVRVAQPEGDEKEERRDRPEEVRDGAIRQVHGAD